MNPFQKEQYPFIGTCINSSHELEHMEVNRKYKARKIKDWWLVIDVVSGETIGKLSQEQFIYCLKQDETT
jgi:hypothetical protein